MARSSAIVMALPVALLTSCSTARMTETRPTESKRPSRTEQAGVLVDRQIAGGAAGIVDVADDLDNQANEAGAIHVFVHSWLFRD